MSTLMAIKILSIAGLGVAFVWWQLRDLAKEKTRTAQSKTTAEKAKDQNW